MFITFEGIDGSGKTTVIKKLKEYIEKKYDINNFVFTREPGGLNLKECEEIRKILLDKQNLIDPTTEMLLYLASRNMHVNNLIKPSIENNKIVICDRFYDSSFAYQGNGRNLGLDFVEKINLEILNNFKPNYTFYFRIDFKTAMSRMVQNNKNLDRFENENQDFFKKCIDGYEYLSKRDNQRYIVIDATKPIDEVIKQVITTFENIMEKLNKRYFNI